MILWPTAASAYAREVDLLIGSFGALVLLLSAPVFVLMAWFMLRYRKGRRADRSPSEDRSIWIETSWSVIPFLLILGFFFWSTKMYLTERNPPDTAMTINVIAKQWMWKFQHTEGAREINDLHVPSDRPVRLTMTSQDVIHSLYVPALRIKQDVLPQRYSQLWFTADKPGVYPIRCAEYCGTDHSEMIGRLIVQRPEDYARWLAHSDTDAGLAQRGERLFVKLGCSGCHGPASPVHAPRLEGLYGSVVALSDRRVIRADDQYIHDSIMLPNKDIAAGYQPIMPPYGNLIGEEEVLQLVAYIKSTKADPERPVGQYPGVPVTAEPASTPSGSARR
ncbi:cytochrome c oxidase subunit II [Novosphingobium sp. 9U]|uniref:cytochrome c oxidase subunit II n=1 Tax=Novosphingobium sp. 9U TaxID=2653158 RepID=UPI0012F0AE21|nr:cytochrome c oxidase subunit II [Novosphingobium sp. 9U]VWX47351.1 Cytochrome c oxidase polypeptide II [Novosphingobium sp. 9U]